MATIAARCFIFLVLGLTLLRAAPADAIFIVVGDQHSAYARSAQFVAHVDRIKAENPRVPMAIFIDGDSFEQGNVVALRSEGSLDVAMFQALAQRAPTIVNLGNHEPEFNDVPKTVARLTAAGVIVIGNIRNRTTGELYAPAATQLDLGAVKVVVAGLTTDVLNQYRAAIRPTLDFSAPEVWAREKFPEFLAAAPVKVVLSHAGLRLDRSVFPFVPDGTLFAGAHDHVQFVERLGRTLYFHSGSWNSHFSLVRLESEKAGPEWTIEQLPIHDSDPADPTLAREIKATIKHYLTDDDLKPIGHLAEALPRTEAAKFVVGAVRDAARADAAFIGNTTFGDSLPAGDVSQVALDACVRFDGTIWTGEVTGARLRRLLADANQGPDTPFANRQGEFHFAAGPDSIEDDRTYTIATNDWGVKNRARYFPGDEINFTEKPGLRLKALTAAALGAPKK
jgi:5'-nucleotidase / UDP-sugar diphosphatase